MNGTIDRQSRGAGLPTRTVLYLAWFGVAAFMATRHVVWRDEVRALTFALHGDSTAAMLRNLHGEGHPALWYLMLRGAHALWPHPQVLLIVAFAVGAAASLLFALRAPFGWPLLAIGLFGRFALYEYTVMARNYGISMLILYALAWLYPRHRDKGWVAGFLLLLLCNTNFPSVILAGAFLLFWAIDLHCEAPGRWDRRWAALAIGAALAAIGVILCAAEVYVPLEDATSVAAIKHGNPIGALLTGGRYFSALLPQEIEGGAILIMPAVLFGLLWQWRGNPGAWIAGAAATIGLLCVFAFLYPGSYRHQALLIAFFLTIAWLRADGHGGIRAPRPSHFATTIEPYAKLAFPALLLFQLLSSVPFATRPLRHMPESRSYELAQLLRQPDLRDAIVIGDPDYMLETLPYYAPNRLYLLRERRWGQYTLFTRAAKRTVRIDELLDTATRIHAETGKPIVILMSDRTYPDGEPHSRGGFGDLIVTPQGLIRLQTATRKLASFDHVANGDESYDVYLYNPPLRTAAPAAIARPASSTGGV